MCVRIPFVFSSCSLRILMVFSTYFSVVPSAVPRRLHGVITGSVRPDLRWDRYSGSLIATIICLEIVRNIDYLPCAAGNPGLQKCAGKANPDRDNCWSGAGHAFGVAVNCRGRNNLV
jgi:hypothetical protein